MRRSSSSMEASASDSEDTRSITEIEMASVAAAAAVVEEDGASGKS